MDSLDYTILGHATKYLLDGDVPRKEALLRTRRIIELMLTATAMRRKDGLDGLISFCYDYLKPKHPEEKFLKDAIGYLLDGIIREYIQMLLRNRLAVLKPDAFETYLCYIVMRGCIELSEPISLRLMEELLYSMLPERIVLEMKE